MDKVRQSRFKRNEKYNCCLIDILISLFINSQYKSLMAKKLSKLVKDMTSEMSQKGISNRKIASELKINEKSVRRILQERSLNNSLNLGGRPKILKKREENALIKNYLNGNIMNSTQGVTFSKNTFRKDISGSLVRKTLLKKD